MTAILKTEAICVRFHPVTETSRIVIWLTPEHGQLTTIIKGSQRPRSAFLGQYDMFYTCELLFYARDRQDVHIARECSPLKTRDAFRTNWRAASVASYITHLTAKMAPPHHPQPELYALLERGLDFLAAGPTSREFICRYELKVAELLGLAPRLDTCMECGKAMDTNAEAVRFAYERGGVICRDCYQQMPGQHLVIQPDSLRKLQQWQKAELDTKSNADPGEAGLVLNRFLQYHFDIPLRGRQTTFDLLAA